MKGVPTNLGLNSTEGIGIFHWAVMCYDAAFLLDGQDATTTVQTCSDLIGLPAGKPCLLLWDGDVQWDRRAGEVS